MFSLIYLVTLPSSEGVYELTGKHKLSVNNRTQSSSSQFWLLMLFVMSFFFVAAAKLQMFRNMIMLFAGMNVNVAIKKILDLPAETCI